MDQTNRLLIANWTAGTGAVTSIDISPTVDVDQHGFFVDSIVAHDQVDPRLLELTPPGPYTSSFTLAPGTYYVHIGGCADICDPPVFPEFSETKTITIGKDKWTPPVLTEVSQSGRRLLVDWANASTYDMFGIEVARNSGDTDADGFFLSQNFAFDDTLDAQALSYDSAFQLLPGTYFVHVAAADPNCVSPFAPICLLFSNSLPVTIPADPTPPPPPPAAKADKVTSFKALKCALTQKVGKLVVRASMAENGTITVGGTISVPNASKVFKIKAVSVKATAGKTVTVKVKLAKKALKAIKRAIKRHKKIKAKLTITAKDLAGNKKTEKRSVKLK